MSRPVILIGQGARGNPALVERLASMGVPVLLTWMSADLLPEDHPAFCGRPGLLGQRAANIILQKASHLYVFGARLDEQTIGFAGYGAFAPEAQVFIIDTDMTELAKHRDGRTRHYKGDLSSDSALNWADLFFAMAKDDGELASPEWLAWCKALYARMRPELEGAPALPGYIDPHAFIRELSAFARHDDVLAVTSSGAAVTVFMQAFRVKQGQVIRFCSTIGAMGADVPMAIGACIASGKRRTITVTGEGGFQLNVQELEVARRLNLPITFFVWNNGGYGSIRAMQDARFGKRLGCDPSSGFTTPPLRAVARCYDLPFYLLSHAEEMHELPQDRGPRIVEVPIDPEWQQWPRVMSTLKDGRWYPGGLEDMTPKLAGLAEIMGE